MPDEKGNLLPGNEGYVAPVETENKPPIQDTPSVVVEEKSSDTEVEETVTKEKYDLLATAFESLLIRENIDVQQKKQYRIEAGLI